MNIVESDAVRRGVVIMVVSAIVPWLARSARSSRVSPGADRMVFRASTGLKIVLAVGFLFALTAFIGAGFTTGDNRRWAILTGALVSVLGFMSWPKSVVVSPTDLRQRSWRLHWKVMRWQEVEALAQKRDGTIIISGTGPRIYLSPYLAGVDQFLEEAGKRGFHLM